MNAKISIVLLLVLLGAISGCKRNQAREDQPAPLAAAAEKGFVFKVRTVPVEYGSLTVAREAAGRIEPDRNVRVASKVGERVSAVIVHEGDTVAKGALLVQLDDRSFRDRLELAKIAVEQASISLNSTRKRLEDQEEQLKAQVQSARQNLSAANRRLQEARSLLQLGGVAPVEVEQLEAAAAQAASQAAASEAAYRRWSRSKNEDLAQLELQLRQARVSLNQARQALGDTRIRAPYTGQVAAVYVENGAFVGPGTPVLQLVAGPRNVIFGLAPNEVARLDLRNLRLWYLGEAYPLRIERTTPVPGQDQLIHVYARIAEDDAVLPYGGAVQVTYGLKLAEGPRVPNTAVRVTEGQAYVFLAENGKARALPVEVVAEANGWAVVKAKEGIERIIHPLPQDLHDGSALEVVE